VACRATSHTHTHTHTRTRTHTRTHTIGGMQRVSTTCTLSVFQTPFLLHLFAHPAVAFTPLFAPFQYLKPLFCRTCLRTQLLHSPHYLQPFSISNPFFAAPVCAPSRCIHPTICTLSAFQTPFLPLPFAHPAVAFIPLLAPFQNFKPLFCRTRLRTQPLHSPHYLHPFSISNPFFVAPDPPLFAPIVTPALFIVAHIWSHPTIASTPIFRAHSGHRPPFPFWCT